MDGKYIYGIIATNNETALGLPGLDGSSPVYTITCQGLSGVVSDYSGREFGSMAKQELIRCLLAHQVVVEHVMSEHTVLPVKFGTVLATSDEVHHLLSHGHQQFFDALTWIRDKVQLEVAATWDLRRILEDIGRQEEIKRLKRAILIRPAEETFEARIQVGRMVKQALDRRRDGYREQIIDFLKPLAVDVQPNPVVADELVINVAFLIRRGQEADFDQRAKELDGIFHGEINFRIIGPLPPYSFTTVGITKPSPQGIEQARQLFGLGTTVSLAEVKQAYRHWLAKSHPDVNPEDQLAKERFTKGRQVYHLLLAYCQGQATTGPEGRFSLDPEAISDTFLITMNRPSWEEVLTTTG